MGIKHLEKVEEFLKQQDSSVSKSRIQTGLGINPDTVVEILEYLIKEKKVEVVQRVSQLDKYQWRK